MSPPDSAAGAAAVMVRVGTVRHGVESLAGRVA
jgi:hypothetical protein